MYFMLNSGRGLTIFSWAQCTLGPMDPLGCSRNSINMDAVNGADLLMAIEEEFDIEIIPEEECKTITVEELVDLILSRLSQTQ